MKKPAIFASDRRLNTLLCGVAAILLSACGAGTTDATGVQQAQTLAAVSSSTVPAAPNNAATAPMAAGAAPAPLPEAAPVDSAEPAADASAPAPAAAPATNEATNEAPAASAPPVQTAMAAPATTYIYFAAPGGPDSLH